MAKSNNTRVWSLILTAAAVLLIPGIVAFVWAQADVKAVDVKADAIRIESGEADNDLAFDIGELKKDGCKPAIKHETDITVLQTQWESIQTEQRAIRTDTQEILKRLSK